MGCPTAARCGGRAAITRASNRGGRSIKAINLYVSQEGKRNIVKTSVAHKQWKSNIQVYRGVVWESIIPYDLKGLIGN